MEYYSRPRQEHLSIGNSQTPPADCDHATSLVFEDRSSYIFPNPPSAPASPSFSSLSTPTEFTSLTDSRSRSRDGSVGGSFPRSSLSDDSPEWEEVSVGSRTGAGPVLDSAGRSSLWWADDGQIDESESMLEEEITRASRWAFVSVPRVHSGSVPSAAYRQNSCEGTGAVSLDTSRHPPNPRSRTLSTVSSNSSPTPHARIRIPLLYFFASILSIDNSTLHLISHTPSHSILFPGLPALPEEAAKYEDESLHGLSLFASTDEESTLRDGLAIAHGSSFDPSNSLSAPLFPLSELFDLMKGAWSGGARGWQELWKK